MKSAEKSLSFFRVFDLAFFAPGLVLALTFALISGDRFSFLTQKATSIKGVLLIIVLIGFIYVLGLINFSIMWSIFKQFIRNDPRDVTPKGPEKWPPFPLMFQHETQNDLILYFWYLRATCLGLACAFGISALLIIIFFIYSARQGSSPVHFLTQEPGTTVIILLFEFLPQSY